MSQSLPSVLLSTSPLPPLPPLPPLSRAAFGLARVVLGWELRRKMRHDLARLDDHLLRDIGLTPAAVADEIAKPFWRD